MSTNFKNSISNPFLSEQFFETEILAKDPEVQKSAKLGLINSKRKYLKQQSIFMSIKQQYINFTHLITKNAIVATVVMLIALTTVGASAAELFAPTEFKPSTQIQNLFGANKQTETDPYTALKPDSQNDVVISKECDLAIKYPKKILNSKVHIYREGESVPATDPNPIDGFNLSAFPNEMEEFETQMEQGGKVEAEKAMAIRCLELNKLEGMQNYFKNQIQNQGARLIASDKSKLQEMTGWFITEANLKNFQHIQGNSYTGDNHHEVYFSFKDKIYWLIFETETSETAGIFGNQVQFQFNSLVKNEANAEILNTNTANNSNTNNQEIQTKTVVLSGNAEGYIILTEYKDTPEGSQFVAHYYTKDRPEFRNIKSTGGAVAEFKVTGKIRNNPKTFELFEQITATFEFYDIEKVEQTNAMQETPTTGSNSNTPAKKTYTNPTYPNLKINYDDSWKLTTNFNYEPLRGSSIKLEKSGVVIQANFLSGVGSMNDYRCFTSFEYYRVGNLVAETIDQNSYRYLDGSSFAFSEESNYRKFMQEVVRKIQSEELGRDQNGNLPPLPSEDSSNICVNGETSFIYIKTNHPSLGETSPVDLVITGVDHRSSNSVKVFQEAEGIIKNSSFR